MALPDRPYPSSLLRDLDARYRAPLMFYFQRKVTSRAEAEDLTQEVFLRITRYVEGTDVEVADGLIFTIAANLMRDRARRARSRSAARHLSWNDESCVDDPAMVERREPERILLSSERLTLVLAALDAIPARTRDIFLLFRFEGMKQREIADRHGISVSAVEKHITKALKELAGELA